MSKTTALWLVAFPVLGGLIVAYVSWWLVLVLFVGSILVGIWRAEEDLKRDLRDYQRRKR